MYNIKVQENTLREEQEKADQAKQAKETEYNEQKAKYEDAKFYLEEA